MAIDLKTVEQLAADQASLKAAAGIAKPGKWSGRAEETEGEASPLSDSDRCTSKAISALYGDGDESNKGRGGLG